MTRHPFSIRLLVTSLCMVALSCGLSSQRASATAISCHLACAKNTTCSVKSPGGGPISLPTTGAAPITYKNCDDLEVTGGVVAVRYINDQSKWVSKALDGGKLSVAFNQDKPHAECSVLTSYCLQKTMEKESSSGGHGISSKMMQPAGTNKPCEKGFPCGAILTPEKNAAWQFKIEGEAVTGAMHISVFRNGHGDVAVAQVKNGVVQVPAGSIVLNTQYKYQFIDSNNKTLMDGYFRTISQKQAVFIERQLNGSKDLAQTVDVLAGGKLFWDAQRLMTANQQ